MGAVSLAQKPSISEKSPARKLNPCQAGSGTKCRKHGQRFFGLGNRKAVGRNWSGLKIRYVWGPRRTLGNHHLNSAIFEFSEIETKASAGFSQLEGSDKGI